MEMPMETTESALSTTMVSTERVNRRMSPSQLPDDVDVRYLKAFINDGKTKTDIPRPAGVAYDSIICTARKALLDSVKGGDNPFTPLPVLASHYLRHMKKYREVLVSAFYPPKQNTSLEASLEPPPETKTLCEMITCMDTCTASEFFTGLLPILDTVVSSDNLASRHREASTIV
jgi:hypothetical protein